MRVLLGGGAHPHNASRIFLYDWLSGLLLRIAMASLAFIVTTAQLDAQQRKHQRRSNPELEQLLERLERADLRAEKLQRAAQFTGSEIG